jgi:hypothetical protein
MEIEELKAEFEKLLDDNYLVDEIHIVAPYPTDEFIDNFITIFKPKGHLYLYIDDAWPEYRVEKIRVKLNGLIRGNFTINRVTSDNDGFVHAKIYYFKWKKSNAGKPHSYKRYLLLGSANASRYGFGKHAETYVLIWRGDLRNDADNARQFPIDRNYFDALKGHGICNLCQVNVTDESWVSLPAIKVVQGNLIISTFDSWLKRGYSLHKFDPSLNFLKFVVKLGHPLPSAVGSVFKSAGLPTRSITQISDSYVSSILIPKKNPSTIWKAKYFIENDYGHWTSEDSFKHKGSGFISDGWNVRKDELKIIKGMTNCTTQSNAFVRKLNTAAAALNGTRPGSASRYLVLNASGVKVDSVHYTTLATAKFKRDHILASGVVFCQQYIAGYAFPSFPTLDEISFEEFARSFCDELFMEMYVKSSTRNNLAKAIKKLAPSASIGDGADLLAWLRNNWQTHSTKIMDYWKLP